MNVYKAWVQKEPGLFTNLNYTTMDYPVIKNQELVIETKVANYLLWTTSKQSCKYYSLDGRRISLMFTKIIPPPILNHQGGWDEMLMFLIPALLLTWLRKTN